MTIEDTGRLSGARTNETVFQFGWDESVQPTTTVVEAVAAFTGREPTKLAPLHESIDTDALNDLMSRATSEPAEGLQLSFRYEGINLLLDSHTGGELIE